MSDATAVKPNEPNAELYMLRREDVAALADGYRQATRSRGRLIPLVVGFLFMPVGVALSLLASYLSWPDMVELLFLAGGLGMLFASLVYVLRRDRTRFAQFRFHCPACNEAFLDHTSGVSRAEIVIATGNCPRCGAHILTR